MIEIKEPKAAVASRVGDHFKPIVAMFEDRAKATAARGALDAAGMALAHRGSRSIPVPRRPGRERLRDAPGRHARHGEPNARRQAGLLGSIKSFFIPDEDASVYAEGVRRGYAVLILRVSAADQDLDKVVALLESENPIDLETSAAEWRGRGGQASMQAKLSGSGSRPSTTSGARRRQPVLWGRKRRGNR